MSPLVRYGALAGAVAAISCAALWIKLAQAPALAIASNRMLVAVLFLLPLSLIFARQELARLASVGHQTRTRYLTWTVLAGLALAAHFGLWTVSLDYTSVASSVVFVSTHPVFVALIEWRWLGQRPSRAGWLGIGMTLVGSLVIGWGDIQISGQTLYGDLLALGGALALVGYLLIGRRLRAEMGFLPYSLLVFTPCWLTLLAASLASGPNPFDLAPGDLPLFLALGLVSTVGGHAVFNWALRHVPASTVAASFVAEPVGASLLAWLFLKEQPPALTLLGGAIILVGVYLAGMKNER